MKIREIKDKMANIAPDLIEEAANYKRKRVSGIRVIAIAACLALLVTSVPLALIMSRKDEPCVGNDPGISQGQENKGENDDVTEQEDMMVIFCSSPSELKKQFAADSKVEIKNANERISFTAMKEVDSEKKDGTPYIRTITIDNITYNASYVYSKTVDSAEQLSDHYQKYVSYDRYLTEYYDDKNAGTPVFEFSQETGELIYFQKNGFPSRNGSLSEDELRQKAIEEIQKLYGMRLDLNPNYRFESKYVYEENACLYYLHFRKYINDFATDEYVSVLIDTSGQIIGIRQNLGLYDEIVETISVEKIIETQKFFYKNFNDELKIQDKITLSLDQFGKCWVKFDINYGNFSDSSYVEIK